MNSQNVIRSGAETITMVLISIILERQFGKGDESGSDNSTNLMLYTSRSFLTASTNHRSPRVRESSPDC